MCVCHSIWRRLPSADFGKYEKKQRLAVWFHEEVFFRSLCMEKIRFRSEEIPEEVDFFVLEQTKVNGVAYILVTDSEDGDAECLILKDTSKEASSDSIYEIVEDDVELTAISKVFEELLEDVEIER